MTTESFIKAQYALLAWREANRFGGTDNMLAVMFVVRNRVRAGWHGGDWTEVLGAHWKYSAEENPGTLDALPDVRDFNVKMLLQKTDEIFGGMAIDRMTDGALYFAELNNVSREWFRKNILEKQEEHPMVAQVGPVAFFR